MLGVSDVKTDSENSTISNLSHDDLQLLFASSPDQELVLTPDFKIVWATQAYSTAYGFPISAIVGKEVYELFPENPTTPNGGPAILKASLERVVKTGKQDRMLGTRYDLFNPASQRWEEKYWSPTNTPVFDSHGKLKFIVHRAHEVTATVMLQKQNSAFTERLHDQDTELLLRVVADQLPAFVSYMGIDHRYKFVNKFYADWFGKPASEIEGHTRAELVEERGTSDYLTSHEMRAFVGERCKFELTLTKPNGEYINLDTQYIPDVDAQTGLVTGLVCVGVDVTARKAALQESQEARLAAEESEIRFRSLSDSLPTLMWTWRAVDGVTYVNDKAKSYLGLKSESEFGQKFIEALNVNEGLDAQKTWYEGVGKGQPFKVEARIRGNDGIPRWFLSQVTPIRDSLGQIDYWIASSTDIDDQRRTAQELFVAKNAAEDANRAKTEFLANMSHEIRTPLNSILGFSDLMKDSTLTTEARTQYAATIARNGLLLTRIIDDILDLAKVEAGRMEAEEVAFSLHDSVNEIMALFADAAIQKSITLKSNIDDNVPKWILSDPTRLRQILINVIGNAVKFTDDGWVNVVVTAHPTGASSNDPFEISFCVTDTGRGIPKQQRERLFKPFTQADSSTTRKYGGTGLGLALSKRLSEALGGTLELVEPEEDISSGSGTEFMIRILAKATSKPETVAAQSSSAQTAKPTGLLPLDGFRVLVVDDSIDNQLLVRLLLKKMGAVVTVASNGGEGVRTALQDSPDVVLMDIQMPGMDGYQALLALKESGFSSPVIALTAHALNEERDKTRKAGFAAHLTKPIDRTALLETLVSFRPMT